MKGKEKREGENEQVSERDNEKVAKREGERTHISPTMIYSPL